jgi:hypothetical protein
MLLVTLKIKICTHFFDKLCLIWSRFGTVFLIMIRNRNFSKVGTGTAINRYGSTTLL